MSREQVKKPRRAPPLPSDPASVLVSASELRRWKADSTTRKVLDYLARWRGQVLEQLADGASLLPEVGASAMKTTEYVAKAQLLDDISKLEAKDIAQFYGLDEPPEQ